MAGWSEIEDEAPDLAKRARAFLEAHTHLTMATLRKDGSPRISGTEIQLRDGEIWLGSMWKGVKALDLRRDPRFAVGLNEERTKMVIESWHPGRGVERKER